MWKDGVWPFHIKSHVGSLLANANWQQ